MFIKCKFIKYFGKLKALVDPVSIHRWENSKHFSYNEEFDPTILKTI